MNEKQIEELRHRRAALVDEMRNITETAESEDRNLSAEETQEFERRESDLDALTERIQRAEQLGGFEPRMNRDRSEPAGDEAVEQLTRAQVLASDGYRDAFEQYTRGFELTAEQRSTLNTATDADGGYAVPEEWGGLIEPLREAGVIRQLATVITTSGGGPLHLPRVSAEADAPGVTAEQAAIADDGQAFDEVVLGAYKYARITKASEEMVQDSIFDVNAFVSGRAGFDIGLATNAHYVSGNGTSQPQGLFTGAAAGVTAASATEIVLDEVIDLIYSVIAPYRQNGVFIANDSTHASVRKMKDTDGQYLWQPSVQAGEPDRLLGYPIYADAAVPAIAANKAVLGFGDVKRAYTIRDAGGVGIKFLDQLYAGNDQVGWRVKLRTDGKIVDAGAFKVLKTKAS